MLVFTLTSTQVLCRSLVLNFAFSFQTEQCRYNPANRAANCSNYSFLPEGDEGALKEALGTIGPISVAIDAKRPRFAFYRSGKS